MRKIDTAWRETELHQTGSTLAPLDFTDFIPAAENALSKASDGKPVGFEPGVVAGDGRPAHRCTIGNNGNKGELKALAKSGNDLNGPPEASC